MAGLVLLAIVLSLIFHDMQYGPQAALIAESFGPNVRYSGAGLGYQLASVIAGGPAPLIAAAILSATGSSTCISWYLVGCAVISMIALLLMPRREVQAAPSRFDEAAERASGPGSGGRASRWPLSRASPAAGRLGQPGPGRRDS